MSSLKLGNVLAVVGAQYGSEGKGVIVNHIAGRYNVHVRTGGSNAGHSFFWAGRKWVMQTIPCGWTNPNAILVLGRGMILDMETFLRELAMIEEVYPDIRKRIRIDGNAGYSDPKFAQEEGGVNGELHQRIGSTGKGVGAARHARMRRNPEEFRLVKDAMYEFGIEDMVVDNTPALIRNELVAGQHVLLEGTQGSGLSLVHGPWPFVTTADTNAAQLAADAGVPPSLVTQVLLVARFYPIRVAGNSGPLEGEFTWEELSARLGKETTERTTVTKKTRRIGEWDWDLMDNAYTLNAPTSIALTFADYMNPENEGKTEFGDLTDDVLHFLGELQDRYEVPVGFVGTGGPEWSVVDRGMGL